MSSKIENMPIYYFAKDRAQMLEIEWFANHLHDELMLKRKLLPFLLNKALPCAISAIASMVTEYACDMPHLAHCLPKVMDIDIEYADERYGVMWRVYTTIGMRGCAGYHGKCGCETMFPQQINIRCGDGVYTHDIIAPDLWRMLIEEDEYRINAFTCAVGHTGCRGSSMISSEVDDNLFDMRSVANQLMFRMRAAMIEYALIDAAGCARCACAGEYCV